MMDGKVPPLGYLKVTHYLVSDYSAELAQLMLDRGFVFTGKTDLKFMETVFKMFVRVSPSV